MAVRIEEVRVLSVGKSKDIPVGFRRFVLCNSGSGTVYLRPADGKKTTEANGFPLRPGEKTDVMTANALSVAAEEKGSEIRIMFVQEV